MIYVLLLLGVTAVWGWTFVLVKDAISQYPTLPFLALRFAIAFLVMAALVRRVPDRRVLGVGAVVGLALSAGYLLQTVGLQSTSPGNAGLITGLFVVFTPVFERAFGRRLPARTVVAVVLALVGIALLAGRPGGVAFGDVLVLGCAVAFSLHIVLLGRWAPTLPAAPLALVQMVVAAGLFGAAGGAAGQFSAPPVAVWPAIAITGVFASALAFFIQTWAQSHLAPSRVALILASEPAWALMFAVLLAGQRLGAAQAFGAALVLVAVIGHEAAGAISGRAPAVDRIGQP
ncbi:MAG TPA: DMT family transporter [Candidatus Dormibacteraeota bacterium]